MPSFTRLISALRTSIRKRHLWDLKGVSRSCLLLFLSQRTSSLNFAQCYFRLATLDSLKLNQQISSLLANLQVLCHLFGIIHQWIWGMFWVPFVLVDSHTCTIKRQWKFQCHVFLAIVLLHSSFLLMDSKSLTQTRLKNS